MKALLRDKADGSLVTATVESAAYDPKERKMYLYTASEDCFKVESVESLDAEDLILKLYREDKADFTAYKTACYGDD